eukprot:scaffold69131_cov36-Cyclotella_meneghiniana.AAC.4
MDSFSNPLPHEVRWLQHLRAFFFGMFLNWCFHRNIIIKPQLSSLPPPAFIMMMLACNTVIRTGQLSLGLEQLLFQEVDLQPSAFPASSAHLMGFRQSKPTVQSLIPLLDYSFEASAPYLSYPV